MKINKQDPKKRVVVVGGDLDVGGVIKNAKRGSVLRPLQVEALKALIYDKGTKKSLFTHLVDSGVIAEQSTQPVQETPAVESK